VILSRGELVQATDIQLSQLGTATNQRATIAGPQSAVSHETSEQTQDYHQLSLAEVEYAHIMRTLEFTGGNKSRAAQILGIERSTLDRRLKRASLGEFDD
jgi:Nif-specific regulatory protein